MDPVLQHCGLFQTHSAEFRPSRHDVGRDEVFFSPNISCAPNSNENKIKKILN